MPLHRVAIVDAPAKVAELEGHGETVIQVVRIDGEVLVVTMRPVVIERR